MGISWVWNLQLVIVEFIAELILIYYILGPNFTLRGISSYLLVVLMSRYNFRGKIGIFMDYGNRDMATYFCIFEFNMGSFSLGVFIYLSVLSCILSFSLLF